MMKVNREQFLAAALLLASTGCDRLTGGQGDSAASDSNISPDQGLGSKALSPGKVSTLKATKPITNPAKEAIAPAGEAAGPASEAVYPAKEAVGPTREVIGPSRELIRPPLARPPVVGLPK